MSQHERVLLVDSLGNPIITAPFQFDDTDKLAVSLYAQGTNPGDIVLKGNSDRGLFTTFSAGSSLVGDGDAASSIINLNKDGAPERQIGRGYIFNGLTWDRLRNNEEITLLASAARTAQADSADQVNYNHQGLILFVDVTVDAAAGAITPNIAVKDPVSGTAKVIWTAAAAIAATGQFVYMLLPGAADAGSYTEQKELAVPRDWFFRMTVADADSLTYSVSCCML